MATTITTPRPESGCWSPTSEATCLAAGSPDETTLRIRSDTAAAAPRPSPLIGAALVSWRGVAFAIAVPEQLEWTTRPHEPGEPARHVAELQEPVGFAHTRANVWRYEPGARGRRHVHAEQEETFVVLAGRLTMYLGEPPERHLVPLAGSSTCEQEPRCRPSTRPTKISWSTPTGTRPMRVPKFSLRPRRPARPVADRRPPTGIARDEVASLPGVRRGGSPTMLVSTTALNWTAANRRSLKERIEGDI